MPSFNIASPDTVLGQKTLPKQAQQHSPVCLRTHDQAITASCNHGLHDAVTVTIQLRLFRLILHISIDFAAAYKGTILYSMHFLYVVYSLFLLDTSSA